MKRIIIIGAGPSGLTAGLELSGANGAQKRLEIVVIEEQGGVGGISRTKEYKGYRFDIGGHRFFTKNDEVRQIWQGLLKDDFLTRKRLSRIYYDGKMFHYPLNPMETFFKLGFGKSLRVCSSYARARLSPASREISLEDWVVNRFGRELFNAFFKSYTEKIWGMPCSQLSADWSAQRIKGLSLVSALRNAFTCFGRKKQIRTLIGEFQYPRLGPGMLWDALKARLEQKGVLFALSRRVTRLHHDNKSITAIESVDSTGQVSRLEGDVFLSSMPLRDLVLGMVPPPPEQVRDAASRLFYRDFITVALIIKKEFVFADNWIYLHDPAITAGRIQNFKNWSPDMVPDSSRTCLGMEYFCFENDPLWSSSDESLMELARRDLVKLGFAREEEIEDGAVIRVKKAYPVYTLGYKQDLAILREYLGKFSNLQLMGRNGLHRYNNQDHSMITGILAARNVSGGKYDVFKVNEDAQYLEEREGGV